MKIVLAEAHDGATLPEKSFDREIVRVGRDVTDCQIVFDNAKFPMVSRKHAELKWQAGQWFLYDLKSSFGTYLNGRKIAAPQIVQLGDTLQFGTDGPVVKVVWFEMNAAPPKLTRAQPPVAAIVLSV